MNRKGNVNNLKNIAEPIAEELNYELVDLEFVKENSDYFLRVYIHKEGGVSLDDCQNMSELLSDKLDEVDPIDVAYYLEVSSPGLDRPLKTDKDLNRNLGKQLEVSLYRALDGMKKIDGMLESYNNEELILITESDESIKIPRDIVSLIKLAVKF